MCGKHHHAACRHLVQFPDEDRAFRLQRANNFQIVDDGAAYVDGRTVKGQRIPHRIDGALHARAETPRRGQEHADLTSGRQYGIEGVGRFEARRVRGEHRLPATQTATT
jgi:hypothetical protein